MMEQLQTGIRNMALVSTFEQVDEGVLVDSVAPENFDQVLELIPDRTLSIFVKHRGEPNCTAVGQRTKAGINVIKARIHQFDRNNETTKDIRDGTV